MAHAARIDGSVIPNHILERMAPADRPKGPAGMTAHECHQAAVAKAEKELQNEIRSYLSLLNVPFICPPMNKKSSLPVGWADFTFAYRGIPVVWECKALGGSLRPEQAKMRDELIRQGWQWRLIRSATDAKDHLREIDAALERRGYPKRHRANLASMTGPGLDKAKELRHRVIDRDALLMRH